MSDKYTMSSAEIRTYFNGILYSTLHNVTMGAYIVYLMLGLSHIFFLDPASSVVMVPTVILTALFMLFLNKLVKGGTFLTERAPLISFIILVFVLLNSLLHIVVTGDLEESTNIVIYPTELSIKNEGELTLQPSSKSLKSKIPERKISLQFCNEELVNRSIFIDSKMTLKALRALVDDNVSLEIATDRESEEAKVYCLSDDET